MHRFFDLLDIAEPPLRVLLEGTCMAHRAGSRPSLTQIATLETSSYFAGHKFREPAIMIQPSKINMRVLFACLLFVCQNKFQMKVAKIITNNNIPIKKRYVHMSKNTSLMLYLNANSFYAINLFNSLRIRKFLC